MATYGVKYAWAGTPMMAVHLSASCGPVNERCLRMKKRTSLYENSAANLFLLRLAERTVAVQSEWSPKPVPLAIRKTVADLLAKDHRVPSQESFFCYKE